MFLTFQLLAGFAFGVWVTTRAGRLRGPLYEYSATLISVLLLWAYNQAMQYLIIWSGNIPEEATWYIDRESGGWMVWTWTLVMLQFILPFLALLSARVRSDAKCLMIIAGVTLVMRFVEAVWLTVPGATNAYWILALAVPATALAVGGAWYFAFLAAGDYVDRRVPLLRRFAV